MELNILITVLIMVALLMLAFFIANRMTRRAVSRVVEIFRKHQAIGIHQAKTIDELGLRPPNLLERVSRMRDYKQNALKILLKGEVIHLTEEGKLYITEEKIQELSRQGI
ncbi:MAG: hypothetical protein KKH04_17830 [Proteobacteria bacterium]|nr:hypothetical protein [Pseudomonadota bacterium]